MKTLSTWSLNHLRCHQQFLSLFPAFWHKKMSLMQWSVSCLRAGGAGEVIHFSKDSFFFVVGNSNLEPKIMKTRLAHCYCVTLALGISVDRDGGKKHTHRYIDHTLVHHRALSLLSQCIFVYSFSHNVFTNFLSLTIHTKLFHNEDTHTTIRGLFFPLLYYI